MEMLPEDVPPVLGEEAKQYQSVIVDGVGKQFGGDEERLREFVNKTRDFGKGELTPSRFWEYLVGAFGEPKALVFLPKLARLVPDHDNRRALLKAPKMASILKHNETLGASSLLPPELPPSGPRFVIDDGSSPPFPRPFVRGGGGGGGGALPPPAAEENPFDAAASSLPPDVQKVRDMFPHLPVPAIEAALQAHPVAAVIELALAGRVDPKAVPKRNIPERRKTLSGRLIHVSEGLQGGKFPKEALPSTMLPRDLAKLQETFPAAPTSLLQAELQVTANLKTAMDTVLSDHLHAEVLELDPVPVALRGYLVKSDPGGRNFTKRFFILRQLTGSLCYARAPEDMEDPLGVIFLFGSRLSAVAPEARAYAKSQFPEVELGAAFSLITPHRTYHLFSESEAEAAAWKAVLSQMADLMVPPEFQAGDDVVECEVFENETYGLLNGWDSTSILPGQRLKYSNRKGELSSEEFPEVRLPGDYSWIDEWHLDKTYTTCDSEGWSYAISYAQLEQDLERGESAGAAGLFDLARRRRWVRTSRRVDRGARKAGESAPLVDFAGAAAAAKEDDAAQLNTFSTIGGEDSNPFGDL